MPEPGAAQGRSTRSGERAAPVGRRAPAPGPAVRSVRGLRAGGYFSSSMPFTFPSARRFSMIFCAMCGGTGS